MSTSAKNAGWVGEHVKLYQTDPEKAHMWDSSLGGYKGLIPVLLLTTKGRKSGKSVYAPLIYTRQGKNFAIIASKGGAPDHPDWFLNMQANPEAEIQVGKEHYFVKASVVPDGPERDRIWNEHAKIYPLYNDYQKKAGDRKIQIVMLEPIKK